MNREIDDSVRSEFARRTLREHHHLSETRSRLRRLLEECINHPGQNKRGELKKVFLDFREHLSNHMLFEEENGYMAPLLEVRPSLALKVEQLEKDHDHIRSELEEMGVQLDSTGEFTQPIMDIVLRLADLMDFVESHERAENGLVMETFFQDTGEKD